MTRTRTLMDSVSDNRNRHDREKIKTEREKKERKEKDTLISHFQLGHISLSMREGSDPSVFMGHGRMSKQHQASGGVES